MSVVHPLSSLPRMSPQVGPASVVRCAAMSLKVMAPDATQAIRGLASEAEDLPAFVDGLRRRSTALLMGLEPCLNWASRAAFCRAAADVFTTWMATTAARPELLAPSCDEALEAAALELDAYLRRHWRAAAERAWSAPVSGRLVGSRAA